MDDKDILFNFFKHYMDQGVEHQRQRSSSATLVLTLAAALIGLATFDGKISGTDSWIGASIFGLGVFGCIWSWKQHERYGYYLNRARGYRDKLNEKIDGFELIEIKDAADELSESEYGWIHRVKLWKIWLGLHVLVTLAGLGMALLALFC